MVFLVLSYYQKANESAFIGNEFYEYLKKQELVLNVNKLGDHKALGILDNFAKKLRTIFYQTTKK